MKGNNTKLKELNYSILERILEKYVGKHVKEFENTLNKKTQYIDKGLVKEEKERCFTSCGLFFDSKEKLDNYFMTNKVAPHYEKHFYLDENNIIQMVLKKRKKPLNPTKEQKSANIAEFKKQFKNWETNIDKLKNQSTFFLGNFYVYIPILKEYKLLPVYNKPIALGSSFMNIIDNYKVYWNEFIKLFNNQNDKIIDDNIIKSVSNKLYNTILSSSSGYFGTSVRFDDVSSYCNKWAPVYLDSKISSILLPERKKEINILKKETKNLSPKPDFDDEGRPIEISIKSQIKEIKNKISDLRNNGGELHLSPCVELNKINSMF